MYVDTDDGYGGGGGAFVAVAFFHVSFRYFLFFPHCIVMKMKWLTFEKRVYDSGAFMKM